MSSEWVSKRATNDDEKYIFISHPKRTTILISLVVLMPSIWYLSYRKYWDINLFSLITIILSLDGNVHKIFPYQFLIIKYIIKRRWSLRDLNCEFDENWELPMMMMMLMILMMIVSVYWTFKLFKRVKIWIRQVRWDVSSW
jgi:hypothetical protein